MNALIIAQALFKKSLRQGYRLVIYIMIPVIGLLIPIMFGQGMNKQSIRIGVVDKDCSRLSRSLSHELRQSYGFEVVNLDHKYSEEALIKEQVALVLYIPNGFESEMRQGRIQPIESVMIRKSLEGEMASQIVESYIGQLGQNYKIMPTVQMYYSDQKQDVSSLTVGLIIVLMSMMTTTVLGSIIEDKKNKMYMRILSTATGCREYLTGQVIFVLSIGILQIGITLGIIKLGGYTLDVTLKDLGILLSLINIMAISVGIGVISFCQTQEHIAIINMLIILPSSILSGCLLPREMMIESIEKWGKIFPQYYIINIAEKMQQGESLLQNTKDIIPFFLICSIWMIVGYWQIERQAVEKMG